MPSDRLAASEDRLRGTPFGDSSRAGNPFEDSATPLELARRHPCANRLDSLAEKLMVALGDSTTMDTLTGNPELLVDRIIAERDALALDKASRDGVISDLGAEIARLRGQLPSPPVHGEDYIKALLSERDDLKTTLRAATEELVRVNDELTEAHAEIKRLQGQLPSPPKHEVEILSNVSNALGGARIQIQCNYPDCRYGALLELPPGGWGLEMVEQLAEAHGQDTKEEPDDEG